MKKNNHVILDNYNAMFPKQDILKNVSAQLKTLIQFLENAGYNEADICDRNVSLQDIKQFLNEQYVNDDFSLNTDKMKNQTEEEKREKINIFKVIMEILSSICVILTILDSSTAQYIIENIPLVGEAYVLLKPQNISINGHINQKTNVYSFSSLSSQITDTLNYGIPIEVIGYHSGWLKINYYAKDNSFNCGWVQENNAIWSFCKN